jgi:putative transposase
MQELVRGYVGQFNARHRRTGTLWKGRCRASLVDSESYVLQCHRLIELNPARARMTDHLTAFAWSSYATHCGHRRDATLTPGAEYTALVSAREAPARACRQLPYDALSDDDQEANRTHLQQQQALGRDGFRAMVEAETQRFAGVRPGRRLPPANSSGHRST